MFIDGKKVSSVKDYIISGDPCFEFDESLAVSESILYDLSHESGYSLYNISADKFKKVLVDVVVNNTQRNVTVDVDKVVL